MLPSMAEGPAGLVKGAFTEEEDKIIIQCMNEGGTISAF